MQNATAIGPDQGFGIVRAMYVAYLLMALILVGISLQFTMTRISEIGARVAAHESFVQAVLVPVGTTEIGSGARSPETTAISTFVLMQKLEAAR